MRIFFIHCNFPAQFRHLAAALARRGTRVFFLTGTERPEWEIPGVQKILFPKVECKGLQGEQFVNAAVKQGRDVMAVLVRLARQGVEPDLVCAHSGWGCGLFVRDVFPEVPFLGYFEWYYDPGGEDAFFDTGVPPGAGTRAGYRCRNIFLDQDLLSCELGLVPTAWQKQQFPSIYQSKLVCRHDGIDTSFFCPDEPEKPDIPGIERAGEIITYCARGLEPARGFPQFMRAVRKVLDERPQAHAIVVGSDKVSYSPKPEKHRNYREQMLEELGTEERIHFPGPLPYGKYRDILRLSHVHVYLTRPFVLSWSLLEAMACGCLVVGSDTPPVREVLEDGQNGLLADFRDPDNIAAKINTALDYPSFMDSLRKQAKQTVKERYSLQAVLPYHLELMYRMVGRGQKGPFG